MQKFITFLRQHTLVAGLILMFLLTWPIDLAHYGFLPFQVPFAVYITLGYGFVIASIVMTWLAKGKQAVIALLKQFLIWKVGIKWYLVALLLIPTIDLVAIYGSSTVNQTPVDFSDVFAYKIFGPSANLLLLIAPYLLFEVFTNGEELGWRGYILPRLQARFSALTSTLILGFIWSFWHIPKFISWWDTTAFIWFTIHTIVLAILLTWLYNNTNGSLLLVTLFHASSNTASVLLPIGNLASGNISETYTCIVLLTSFIAVLVAVIDGPTHLSGAKLKQIQD